MNYSEAPEPEESIFRECTDWQNNAFLEWPRDKWEVYTDGYRAAAELLVQQVMENLREREIVVYPIVFLYRHYLELRLKQLIFNGNCLLRRPVGPIKTHKIDGLWNQCRLILEEVWPDGDKALLDTVGNRIGDVCAVDQASMAFRYPEDNQGNEHLQDIKIINLRHLFEVMSDLADTLDGVNTGITELQYLQDEADAEWREMERELAREYGTDW